jgi:hypothetical protein
MIDIRTATLAAINYIDSIQDLLKSSLENLNLEEAEISEDEKLWLITLGYDKPNNDINASVLSTLRITPREYKLIKVKADTGDVVGIGIRKL